MMKKENEMNRVTMSGMSSKELRGVVAMINAELVSRGKNIALNDFVVWTSSKRRFKGKLLFGYVIKVGKKYLSVQTPFSGTWRLPATMADEITKEVYEGLLKVQIAVNQGKAA